MQYLSIVNVLQCQTNLCEPIQNMVLAPILQLPSSLLLLLILVLYPSLKVSAVCVVHDNAEFSLLGFVNLAETYDVRVLQYL